jgi:hypothetical protein
MKERKGKDTNRSRNIEREAALDQFNVKEKAKGLPALPKGIEKIKRRKAQSTPLTRKVDEY